MKKWIALVLILGWATTTLEARVNLPESGRLAGPLNTLASESGQAFVNFPLILQPTPPGNGVPLTGWLEVTFGDPDGDLVDFTLDYRAVASDGAFIFGGAQLYFVFADEIRSIDGSNGGTLDLATGRIVDFEMNVAVHDSATANVGRLNRTQPYFVGTYPAPDDFGVDLGPLPPGFVYADAFFNTDRDGNIVGFDFRGRTLYPLAPWAGANAALEFFPPFAFAPGDAALIHNPDRCLNPDVPVEICPTDEANPDGLVLPDGALFHSHLTLQSNELRPVPVERAIADCAPEGRSEGIVEAAGGKLYHISGLSRIGLSAKVDVFDPATGIWSEGPDIPTPVIDAQSASVGTNIYVIGGRSTVDGPAISTVQILDTTTGTWSNGAAAPVAVARGGAEPFGGAIYVLFGMTNDEMGSPDGDLIFNQNILLYGPEGDEWLQFPVPFALEGFASLVAGADIYMINGKTILDGEEALSSFVFVFSALFNDLFFGPPTRVGIYDGTAGIIGNRLYLTGGSQGINGAASQLTQTLELGRNVGVVDALARSFWSPEAALPFAAAGQGAVLKGEFYVVGGSTTNFRDAGPTNAVQQLSPSRGWAVCDTQPLVSNNGLLNTASLAGGSSFLTSGGLATLEGHNFADEAASSNDDATVPTTLNGIRVLVDSNEAPILSVSPTRIDFQVPYSVLPLGDPVSIEVIKEGSPQQAERISAPIRTTNPGIFQQTCGETRDLFTLFLGSGLACHADGTLNTMRNAARPGEDVTLQMTGLGSVDTMLGNGERAPAGVNARFPTTVQIIGDQGVAIEAPVKSATLAEGQVGVYNVTFTLPDNTLQGNRVAVQVEADGLVSNIAMISVGEPVDPNPPACMYDTDPAFRACLPEFSPIANN